MKPEKQYLTYCTTDIASIKPSKGDLRVWFNDDRQYWGISPIADPYYYTAWSYWAPMGGEKYDGEKWVRLDQEEAA